MHIKLRKYSISLMHNDNDLGGFLIGATALEWQFGRYYGRICKPSYWIANWNSFKHCLKVTFRVSIDSNWNYE